MTDTALSIPSAETTAVGLDRYAPANLKQLVWFAGEVAKSGMYLKTDASGNQVVMTQAETFMVMSEGIEMGVAPLTAMRNIYLMEDKKGRKTTIPRADLLAARIQADPRTEQWDMDDETPGTVTVTAKRQHRAPVTITMTLDDIPSRDKERWARGYLDTQEMLTNRTIRRIARRHFKDMVLGMGVDQDVDERQVIDVAKVENVIDRSTDYPRPHSTQQGYQCYGKVFLESGSKGGVYLRCQGCGVTFPPPQEVRDAVRGTPSHLTVAGAAEPVLEPGERTEESYPLMRATFGEPVEQEDGSIVAPLEHLEPVIDAPSPAVQSDEPSATIDAPSQPASAEAPIPEPDARSFEQRWRDTAREKLIEHLEESRLLASSDDRMAVVKALRAAGWDSDVCSGNIFIGSSEDRVLTQLLDEFKIKVLP